MGVTIHYKGYIDKHERIDDLTSELVDISKEMGWKHTIINDSDKGAKGIIMSPHEKCEPFSMIFNKQNAIVNFLTLVIDDLDDEYSHIKTQLVPVEVHVAIIKLLKHLDSKYLTNLEVTDEGDFWDTMDVNILVEKMNLVQSHIDFITDVINASADELEKAESVESLGDKIEGLLKKMGYKSE